MGKTNIKGGIALKRETWAVCRFKETLAKKEGGVFEELIPQCTLWMDNPLLLQKKSIASPFYLLWSFKKIYKWGGGSDIQKNLLP